MKFSIIIPTYNRPELLSVALKYAMQIEYPDFEIIVSDNSSTESLRKHNDDGVSEYKDRDNFKLVRPSRVMSPPEHFEFALDFATGDYVVYLTDKMIILPHILTQVAEAISGSGAEIVNWSNAPYQIESAKNPSGPGTLILYNEFLGGGLEEYDPKAALAFKASCAVPRDVQSTKDYVAGKIIFGCYSKVLIKRVLDKSGTTFGGATHDYSAMVQALSVAKTCILLNAYGVIFISLPRDQSLGSLTTYDSQQALNYYRSFSNTDSILSNLLIPDLYASSHNMVAHDYKKFLPIHGNADLFDEANWYQAIYADLTSDSKVWLSVVEKNQQLKLFKKNIGYKIFHLRIMKLQKLLKDSYQKLLKDNYLRIMRKIKTSLFSGNQSEQIYQVSPVQSLADAVQLVLLKSTHSKAD